MKRDKKLDEMILMQYFIEKYPEFPKGKLVQQESPDFILRVSRKKHIGIELTQIRFLNNNEPKTITEISSIIKKTIQKKNEKLRLYNASKPFQNWLIIYCESLNIRKNTKFSSQLKKVQFESGFNIIFLFDLFAGLIIELTN